MDPEASPLSQRPSALLSNSENNIVFSLFPLGSVSLATAVVQIFVTSPPDHDDWTKMDAGVLCLVKDHLNKGCYHFRVYCPERQCLLWEHEVYKNMKYNAPSPFFHSFEAQDCIVGFNFASEDEALGLRNTFISTMEREKGIIDVTTYKKDDKKIEKNHKGKIRKEDIGLPFNFEHICGHSKIIVNEKDCSLLDLTTLKKNDKKMEKKLRKKIRKEDIGMPSNFKHIFGYGPFDQFGENKGRLEQFCIEAKYVKNNVGKISTFCQLFSLFYSTVNALCRTLQAGVSVELFQNKDVCEVICEFVKDIGGVDKLIINSQIPGHSVSRDNHTRPPPGSNIVDIQTLPSRPSITNRGGAPPPPPPPPPPSVPAADLHPPPISPRPTMPAAADPHQQLLDAINKGITLKPTVQPSEKPSSQPEAERMWDLLKDKINKRFVHIHPDSDSNEEDAYDNPDFDD